ncbi:MAG: serine hydrolase [Terricaulis sp.]
MKQRVWKMALLLCVAPFAMGCASQRAPAEHMSEAAIARYANDLFVRNHSTEGPGAAVLVARGDTVLFRAARGEADVDIHVPLRPESVFRIGSVTKQFTAAGLLTLVEAERVSLDDPLSKYLPDYPGGDGITLLQLLNHTSGVRNYTGMPGYMDGPIREDMSTAQIVMLFGDEPPDFAPGERWAYSNSGYVLIGAVIEAVTGMPWHAYLAQALFEPLGMNNTGYSADPRFAGQVHGYSYEGDTVVPMLTLSMTQAHAAGALVSNVDDLLTWNRALHEGRVLRSAAYTQMITPVGEAAAAEIRYSFGLFNGAMRDHQEFWHGGRIFGFISSLSYLPGPDITVVVLENDDAHQGVNDGYPLTRRLAAIALGDPYPDMTPMAVDVAALQAMEGVYRFDADTTRTLRVVDENLTSQRSGMPRLVLTPIGVDDFLYPDGFSRLKLERDAGGAVGGIRFFANGEGDGEIGARTNEPLPVAPVALQLPRATLERFVGGYANSEVTLTISLEGEALKVQIVDQPAFDLRATSSTQFEQDETGASLEFSAGDALAAELTLRQNGRETVLRRYARAIADHDQAIRLNPQDANAFYNRGLTYHAQHDYARAVADFDQAIRLQPNNADMLNGRCWARAVWGQQLDQALADCDASLRIRSNDAGTLDSRGLVHLRRGEFQAAFTDYDAAVRGDANLIGSLYGRGIARLRLGRTAEGRADIVAATARDANVAATFAGRGISP